MVSNPIWVQHHGKVNRSLSVAVHTEGKEPVVMEAEDQTLARAQASMTALGVRKSGSIQLITGRQRKPSPVERPIPLEESQIFSTDYYPPLI